MEVAGPSALRRTLPGAAVVVATLVLLAGGAVGEEARPQPAPEQQIVTPAQAAPQQQPAPQAAHAKVLRVATSGDYAPFSFETSGSGGDAALDGLDVEIARLFAKDRGYRVEIVRFRWPDLSRELAAGSFDVAMSGVTARPERSIAGRLSVPVAATQAVALTWKGSGVETLVHLDKPGRRITVNAGGHLEKVARGFFRRAEIVTIADNAAVRMALLDRMSDAVVTDNFEEKVWTVSAPDAVRVGTLSDDRKAYLLPAANAELAAELDRWLLARAADGTLAGLRRRYIRNSDGSEIAGGDETLETAEPVAALAAAVRERLDLMPFVYEAKKAEGKPIEDAAQEAAVLDAAVRSVAAEAAAAGAAAPDAQTVRELFGVLIAAGKDAQKRLADDDTRVRRGNERRLPDDGEVAGSPQAQAGAANPEADGAATSTGKEPARNTGPDLATEIRPAIARIGEKIARILVAMKKPVPAREARSRLEASLSGHGVRGEHLDGMAQALARISSGVK